MQDQALNILHKTMDEQVGRKHYPDGFPVLPEVPTGRYFDPRFEALEKEHLWKKTWLLACLATEIPTAGSYRLFEQVDQSVIVSRGKGGEIRAFHNTCRHRASALLLAPQGKAMRFVCPYHAWGYSLEGKLISVPDAHDFACLDKSERGLLPVRVETWRGLVFINLDDNAEPLADFMAPLASQTKGYPLEKLVVKDRLFVPMDTNWKTAYHNFLEIYHVGTVHAKSIAPFLDSASFVVALLANGHSRFATRKRKGATIFKTDLAIPEDTGELFKQCTVALPKFPNTFFALDPIGFTMQSFWPAGPGKSVMEARLLGWESDLPQDRDYWATMRTAVEDILAEDLELFGSIQRGLESGLMPKVLMGYQERALYWFEEEVDRRIGVDRIPEDMRITPVLADQVSR
jgi:phenylpropionate dioxygenase-like ring-hydroxylating dioxygenase large terminal subunit